MDARDKYTAMCGRSRTNLGSAMCQVLLFSLSASSLSACNADAPEPVAPPPDVLTQRNDLGRTGTYTQQGFNSAYVGSGEFGLLATLLVFASHVEEANLLAQFEAYRYRGQLLAIDAKTLKTVGRFMATPTTAYGGGIWQASTAPADGDGNIFFTTGNRQ